MKIAHWGQSDFSELAPAVRGFFGGELFKKILIANRGEIALRIIRACKELGIRTVSVHSEADAASLHVNFADEDICIGAAPSEHSYLSISSIITAAEISGAEAIHPGYGFLAENAHFAEVCQSCQITFIGPSVKHLRLMGNKSEARRTMSEAKVPIILGSKGVIKDEKGASKIAKTIGYPVIIKAASGGGGKGMRIVRDKEELVDALRIAQSEAQSSFGNSEIYIEKYIEGPRHIEFQILGDRYGNIVHLGERDCSIQRRHQKLIEESPSPSIDSGLRKAMGKAALAGARAVKYTNAGTIEFLLDKDNHFYFMEMNTRIQVEHPVTEMVTSIDLIKEQIRVAAGEKLGYTQKDIKMRGHALECRINAEDPERDFLPCPGVITALHLPGGPGIRVETHAYPQCSIPPFYDSLVAKLISHGRDRREAIVRMKRALEEFVIEGIKTTIPFHRKVLDNPHFEKGEICTDFVERIM